MELKKILISAAVLVLVANIVLFGLRLINEFIFWTIIALGAILAFFVKKKPAK